MFIARLFFAPFGRLLSQIFGRAALRGYTLCCFLGLVVLFSGCKSEPSIIGTWESTGIDKVRITFRDDMAYELAILRFMDATAVKGRFKRLENKITFYDNKIDIPMEDLFGGAIGEFMSRGLLKETKFTMTWKTDDEIILKGDGLIAKVFKRISGVGQ